MEFSLNKLNKGPKDADGMKNSQNAPKSNMCLHCFENLSVQKFRISIASIVPVILQ